MEFKTGDVVRLNSGGPKMTVDSVDSDGAQCIWFHNNKPQYGSFPVAALKKAASDGAPTSGG